jgi:predicted ABC-type sugar transport system permease subunit
MTEFELNNLILGQTVIVHQAFQVWAVATSSLVIAAYAVGNKIDASLRRIILVTYTLLALGSIGSWCNSLYYNVRLGQRLTDAGAPLEMNHVLGDITAFSLVAAFLVGTVGAIAYMIKAGKRRNP